MKRILRWTFDDNAEVDVPVGEVRLVAARRAGDVTPSVWIEHTDPVPSETMRLRLYGTGDPLDNASWVHVGSAVCANGDGVWHVYRWR